MRFLGHVLPPYFYFQSNITTGLLFGGQTSRVGTVHQRRCGTGAGGCRGNEFIRTGCLVPQGKGYIAGRYKESFFNIGYGAETY